MNFITSVVSYLSTPRDYSDYFEPPVEWPENHSMVSIRGDARTIDIGADHSISSEPILMDGFVLVNSED